MRIRLLAPGGDDAKSHNPTSFLINDTLVIDAGFIGFYETPKEQAQIQHLLLSNTRASNTASLAIFVENAYEPTPDCVTIHASGATLAALQEDVFNDRIWPDFIGLSEPKAPFLKTTEIQPGQAMELEGLRITAAEVNSAIPTLGFLVENASAATLFVPNTGPTESIWELADGANTLDAVFVHLPYSNESEQEALAAHMLTPALLSRELAKLRRPPKAVFAVLSRAAYADQILQELQGSGMEPMRANRDYYFG